MKNLFILITLLSCYSVFCFVPQKDASIQKEEVMIVFQKDMFKGIKSEYPLMSVNNTVSLWPIVTIDFKIYKESKKNLKVQKFIIDDAILISLSGPIKGLQFNLPNFVKLTFNIKSRQAYLVSLNKSLRDTDTLSLNELPNERYMKLKRTINSNKYVKSINNS